VSRTPSFTPATTRHSAHVTFLLSLYTHHIKPISITTAKLSRPFIKSRALFDAPTMAVRQPDQIPPGQVTAEGYESPSETVCCSWSSVAAHRTNTAQSFKALKEVYSLTTWIEGHATEALEVLGKKRSKLGQATVRLHIWPAKERHTHCQLRAIWKYWNNSCHKLAPYGKL
jgi:hypothetical protein